MKTKAEISKITITVAGQKLELTLEEARDLKKALNDALEPTYSPSVYVERHIERQNPWPHRPIPMWATTMSRGEYNARSAGQLQITG